MNSEHFTVIGEGNVGDKAEQLMHKTQSWLNAGGYVPHRTVLAQSIVEEFLARNGLGRTLEETVHAFKTSRDTASLDARIRNGSLSMEDLPGLNLQPEHLGYGRDGLVEDMEKESKLELASRFIGGFFNQEKIDEETRLRKGMEIYKQDIKEGKRFLKRKRPFVVRSSGKEARGIGVYETEFCLQRNILNAIKTVIASYFTGDAILHRQKAKQEEMFAVMLEPLIGTRISTEIDFEKLKLFMPTISGYGYSSTSKGPGYISLFPGIGGGVQERGGLILTRKELEQNLKIERFLRDEVKVYDNTLSIFLMDLSEIYLKRFGNRNSIPNLLIYGGKTFVFDHEQNKFYKHGVGMGLMELFRSMPLQKMIGLFDRLTTLEQEYGPQYIEFAMTLERPESKIWLTQIDNQINRTDSYQLRLDENVLLTATSTKGQHSGKEVHKIVIYGLGTPSYVLKEFNDNNSDYVLIYNSEVVKYKKNIPLSMWSNAAAILERPEHTHVNGSSISHFTNQADELNVLFGIINNGITPTRYEKRFLDDGVTEYGLSVLNGNFKVICSEQQDWMQVIELK